MPYLELGSESNSDDVSELIDEIKTIKQEQSVNTIIASIFLTSSPREQQSTSPLIHQHPNPSCELFAEGR